MKDKPGVSLHDALVMGEQFNKLMGDILNSLEHHTGGVLLVVLLVVAAALLRHGWPPKK